jgi:hypothetical protein
VIPAAPTQGVIAALGTRAEIHHYQNGYHMLLRGLDRARPIEDIAAWMESRSAGQPGGATASAARP